MEPIANVPSLAPSQTTNATASDEGDADRGQLSSDFETFLRMLTAQVQNQDPLNPVDSTDYATQLAQFSSVEQQVLTNDLLRDISGQGSGEDLQRVAGWIGMEGLVRGTAASFEGQPIAIRPDYDPDANLAELIVKNENGDEVQRFELVMEEEQFLWAGVDDDGNLLPPGNYEFSVQNYDGRTKLGTTSVAVYSQISEVRSDGGDILLRMADGSEIESNLVSGLRWPTAP